MFWGEVLWLLIGACRLVVAVLLLLALHLLLVLLLSLLLLLLLLLLLRGTPCFGMRQHPCRSTVLHQPSWLAVFPCHQLHALGELWLSRLCPSCNRSHMCTQQADWLLPLRTRGSSGPLGASAERPLR